MNNNDQPSKFKVGPIEIIFDSKDSTIFKISVILIIVTFILTFVILLKIYVLPLLLINGMGSFISKIGIKILGFIGEIKNLNH
jgi:hypothetical protein